MELIKHSRRAHTLGEVAEKKLSLGRTGLVSQRRSSRFMASPGVLTDFSGFSLDSSLSFTPRIQFAIKFCPFYLQKFLKVDHCSLFPEPTTQS